jgi:CubicO group peptidase (beta-lactamase class C family)
MPDLLRRRAFGAALCVLVLLTASAPALASAPPPDDAIRKLIAERALALAGPEDGIGIVVGVIAPGRRSIVAYGHPDDRDPQPVGGDTAFEIGSVGKVLTALVLAEMVVRHEVSLDDPVSRYLPKVKVPERNGRSITLLDLATHTSGLPFMPDELPLLDEPGSAFGPQELQQFLARFELTRDIGARWEYSNLGYWLLGEALAARAGMDFPTLLADRVTRRLRMHDTTFRVYPRLAARVAVGHDAVLRPSPPASAVPLLAALPGAGGGLLSTADDMLTLLSLAIGHLKSRLTDAAALMETVRRPAGRGSEQALGWVVSGEQGDRLFVHDGATLGHASSLAWDPKSRTGIVVLSNHVSGVGDIARHLLRPQLPLDKPAAARRTEVAVASAVLDAYAGRYEAPGEGVFVLSREREFLTFQAPSEWGLPRLRLRPESLREFFAAEVPLRVTFERGKDGRVSAALIHPPRGQQAIAARRVPAGK